MFKTIAFGFAAGLLALGFAGGAQASLLGQTVTCERGPSSFGICTSPTATVMDGGVPEFTLRNIFGDITYSIDLLDDRIVMTALRFVSTSWSQLVTLGDLISANDPNATITGITNFLVSGVEPRPGVGDGLVESDVSFTANSVTIDYSLAAWTPGDFVSFDLVTTQSVLPEPASLALFGLGLAARQRNNSNT